MKLTRKVTLEILNYAATQVVRKDMVLWEIVVAILRYAADTIEKYEKE